MYLIQNSKTLTIIISKKFVIVLFRLQVFNRYKYIKLHHFIIFNYKYM